MQQTERIYHIKNAVSRPRFVYVAITLYTIRSRNPISLRHTWAIEGTGGLWGEGDVRQ